MRWLLAACASGVVFCAAALATFVPLHTEAGIEYWFIWPPASRLLIAAGVGVLGLLALFSLARVLALRRAPAESQAARSGRWLAPLSLLGVVALGILPAAPGVGERASVVGYFFYDLRWWWAAILSAWAATQLHRALGSPLSRAWAALAAWSPHARLRSIEAALFAGLVAWAILTTPALRFTGGLHGDEPKYIRLCEVWFQGGGLDISQKRPFSERPFGTRSAVLENGRLLIKAIRDDSRSIVTDTRDFLASPRTFRWNRAHGADGFVTGKRGGVYEIYQPGLSAILFPGYWIDRTFFGRTPGYQDELPAELVMTNATMLAIYGACGIALFRLLRRALVSESLALAWAAIAMLTLPATAFAFQLYPELPAACALICIVHYLLFAEANSGRWRAALAGVASGGIAWLHPRFLLLAGALVIIGAIRMPAARRRVFIGGATLALLSVMAFNYHITGSAWPTAVWDAQSAEPSFRPAAVPLNLIGYLFDNTWGLLPHSPILLAAAPGLVVLWRASRSKTAALVLVVLSLFVPAAAHTLSAAGGTPDRLVVAVVPLLMWPAADAVRRFWSWRWTQVATLVLVVLSVDAGLSYNLYHEKALGPIHGAGASGWRPNLAFPVSRHLAFGLTRDSVTFAMLLALVIGVTILAWRADRTGSRGRVRPVGLTAVGVVVACLAVSMAATAADGVWTRDDYAVREGRARELAARALVALDRCRVCFTSVTRHTDWTRLEPNYSRGLLVDANAGGALLTLHIAVDGANEGLAFGRVQVDYGDGTDALWQGIVAASTLVHRYRRAGLYDLSVTLLLRDGGQRVERRTIRIGAG